jgi:acyl carrier protein
MPDLVTQLSAMIVRVTDCDPAGLHADTRFDAVEGWSSLQALSLMVAIEQDLPVKLDLRPFMAVQTVGELAALVARDLSRTAGR